MKILAATNNAHKLHELRTILSRKGIEVLAAADIGGIPEVDETGETFIENAVLKAVEVARATGYTVFADDSGLEVMALGREPGVRSARYADTDAARMAKVLTKLEAHEDRSARFVCVIALAAPQGLIGTAEGEVRGRIAPAPRGDSGFGYDPIFVPAGEGRTFAEMTGEEKDAISHRGRALEAALAQGLFEEKS